MVVIPEDKRIRIIKLTGDELRSLIEGIENNFSYSIYDWYKPIINKLRDSLKGKSQEERK